MRFTALVALIVGVFAIGLSGAQVPSAGAVGESSPSPAAVRDRLDEGRWREALELASALVARDPADPESATVFGQALFRGGRLGEVEKALEPALRAEPVPLHALVTLARLRHAEGRPAPAVELIEQALARAPDDREVLYQASEIVRDRGRALELLRGYLDRAEGDDPERREAARGAARVYEALGDTPIWFDRSRPESLELPLRRLWDPTNGVIQGYIIQARIGAPRRAVPLLLDSGSPGLYLIDRASRRREFEPLAQRTVFGGGGDGRHRTSRGYFPTFVLDGLAFGNALATSTPDDLDPIGRYHGLLGFGIFGGYRASLDLQRARLMLGPSHPSSAEDQAVPYWTVGGQMLVAVEVRTDEGQSEPALFLLDTGATRTLISLELAGRLSGVEIGREIDLRGFGGRRQARVLDGARVAFAGHETASGSTRAVDLSRRSRLGGIEVSGFLGLDLLDGRVLTIDGPRREVTLRAGRPARGRRSGRRRD